MITTGGLGPTSDDLTNESLAAVTGREMVEYPEARAHVDEMFRRFGREPTANNYKQALFPEGTKLIPNPLGTAPGALLEADGTLFATLPGVPSEMKGMFEETLEPLIRDHTEGSIVSRTLWFAGIGESRSRTRSRTSSTLRTPPWLLWPDRARCACVSPPARLRRRRPRRG